MFKCVAALIAFFAIVSSSSADDYASRTRAFNWTGFYVGAHGGQAWGDARWKLVTDNTNFVDFPDGGEGAVVTRHDLDGWVGGGHIGYQKQFGAWVFGAELSYSGTSIDGTSESTFESKDDLYKTEVNGIFLGTVRAGYAWDRWLAYLKGGYASASVKTSIVDTSPGLLGVANTGTWSSRERHHGWTVGAGIEYAWLANVVVGLQYDYVSLGDENHSALGLNGAGAQQLWAASIDTGGLHMITARINYKF